jgi:hypothetical protein
MWGSSGGSLTEVAATGVAALWADSAAGMLRCTKRILGLLKPHVKLFWCGATGLSVSGKPLSNHAFGLPVVGNPAAWQRVVTATQQTRHH